jgi:hypothetical protein
MIGFSFLPFPVPDAQAQCQCGAGRLLQCCRAAVLAVRRPGLRVGPTQAAIRFLATSTLAPGHLELERYDQWLAAQGLAGPSCGSGPSAARLEVQVPTLPSPGRVSVPGTGSFRLSAAARRRARPVPNLIIRVVSCQGQCFRQSSARLGHALAKATVMRLLATPSLLPSGWPGTETRLILSV